MLRHLCICIYIHAVRDAWCCCWCHSGRFSWLLFPTREKAWRNWTTPSSQVEDSADKWVSPCKRLGWVELTNHIFENATSLKQLVLDTAYGRNKGRCCMCTPLTWNALMEARKAVDVIKRCIQGQVPSSVKFKVIEPCIKCNTDEACKSKIIN